MGVKRIVDTSFWTDGKVDEFSPEDKYFMLYLLTNPFSTQLGIYEISTKQAAFQLGYSEDVVKVLIDRFERKYGMIIYSRETREIAVRNFLRHSIVKGGAPVRDLLIKEIKKVKNKGLVSSVFAHIRDAEDLNETVKNVITEYEEKNGALQFSHSKKNDEIANDNYEDNENDNENDNEVSYHDTPTNRSKSKKPIRHKYGEYNNVLLTDDELDKLKSEFSDWSDRIERLSSYVASTGKSYKSHYATIRNWARKDQTTRPAHKGTRIASNERIDPIALKQMQRVMGRQKLDRETIDRWENNEPPTTAGNDENVRKRAEALRTQLGGGAYRE